jgi:hypothetical protein
VPEEADLAKPTAKPKKTERGARKPRKTP